MAVRSPGAPKNPFTRYERPKKSGGQKPPKPDVTTLAVGEEGGTKPPKPDVTTLAVGEEAGSAK